MAHARCLRALLLLSTLLGAPASAAVSFMVDSADDADDAAADGTCATAAGLCSLRAALTELNADAQGGAIAFSLPAGTTIALSAPLPTVTRPLLLDGAGAPGLSVVRGLAAASATGGILAIAPGAGVQVELRNLRLAGAKVTGSGGAVLVSSGSLRLSGVVLEVNTAGGDGGAIAFSGGGALQLTGCSFTSNVAARGGAIRLAGGTLALSNGFFFGNQATQEGGALSLGGDAAAAVRGSSLAYNQAYRSTGTTRGGAIAVDHGSATALLLRQVTLHGNNATQGGGLSLGDTATAALENSVLAGNTAAAGQEADCEGTVTSATHALLGASGGSCAGAHGSAGSRVGTPTSPIDPVVQHDSGIGIASVLMPGLGSPLRDAGDPAICALADVVLDPRGVSRDPGNDGDGDGTAACDIGAAEAPAPGPPSIERFSATLATLTEGDSTYLEWTAWETLGCTIADDAGGAPAAVAPSGSRMVTPAATTTYTLTCPGVGVPPPAAAVATVTITVNPAPVVAVTAFTAAPATVAPGGSSTLSFTYENANSGCTLSYDASSDYVPAYGSGTSTVTVTPAATTSYTLSCPGNHGPATATVTVTVAAPATVSITSFTATPAAMAPGGGSTLAWEVADAIICEITGGAAPVSATPPSGTLTVGPSATTTYTLTCQGNGGPVAATATVTVSAAPVVAITSFTATPATVAPGGNSTLAWAVSDATSCEITGGAAPVSAAPPSGSLAVTPAATTSYTLTCQGNGGPVAATATVTATADATPVISSFTATLLGVAGDPAFPYARYSVQWETANWDACQLWGELSGLSPPLAASGSEERTASGSAMMSALVVQLRCQRGTLQQVERVDLVAPPSITVMPFGTIYVGESVPIVAPVTRASSCSLDGTPKQITPCTGGWCVSLELAPTETTTYALSCRGDDPLLVTTVSLTVTVLQVKSGGRGCSTSGSGRLPLASLLGLVALGLLRRRRPTA